MASIRIRFEGGSNGRYPVLDCAGTRPLTLAVPDPLDCAYLRGDGHRACYNGVESLDGGGHRARLEWTHHGARFALCDEWRAVDDWRVRLDRHISLARGPAGPATDGAADGIQLRLRLRVRPPAGGSWRFFAPARLYGQPDAPAHEDVRASFMDDRLAYPLIMGYDARAQTAVVVSRAVPGSVAHPPVRPQRESSYLQETDLGALGLTLGAQGAVSFDLYWPYLEGDASVTLDARLTPVSAFYPLAAGVRQLILSYEVSVIDAEHLAAAAFTAFRQAPRAIPRAAALPFSLPDAVEYRCVSLRRSYREWEPDGAAFFCSFDPTRGYDTPPSGFGTQFVTIPSDEYRHIIEYGFTGRQLNAAYVLAQRYRGVWVERGRRVADFFVRRCTLPTGWMYSLYDVSARQPLHSISASRGALLHYGGHSNQSGNFLRTMVESAFDLLLNYRWHRAHAAVEAHWLDACLAFGHFLVRHQNGDGSWYRAYGPEGEPITGDRWLGSEGRAAKSATMIPVAYLAALGEEDQDGGAAFLGAAKKAGDYVLAQHVARDHYQGATLDNPNVVDKEAALYTMSALLALYDRSRDPAYLSGAERAAQLAVTWTFLWNPPFYPGSRLDTLGFKAAGWGGINSIWGGGVVDIYALFFLADFLHLSDLTGEPFYREAARLIAEGTQQLLSHPGDLLGYADIGMQPEGVGITSQGLDEGLIAKGDTWGSLGWIYQAGIYGLERYLHALNGDPDSL